MSYERKKINFYIYIYLETETSLFFLKSSVFLNILKISGRFKIDICVKSKKYKKIRSSFSNDEAENW